MKDKKWLAHLALLVVSFIYASNFTIAKPVMGGSDPFVQPFGFIMLRASFATILFWITHRLFVRENVERIDLLRLAICAIFGVACNQLTFFYGLNLTSPINGALIMLTTPILVLILSFLMRKEQVTLTKIVGVLIGLGGASFLILKNTTQIASAPNPMLGNLFVGINAASYAFYLILVKPLMNKYSPITNLKWIFFFGTIYILPFGFEQARQVDWSSMPTHIILSIGYVLLFVTFLNYLLNGAALKVVEPSLSSAYIYLQPLFATIIAIAMGQDELSLQLILSGILIFTGVLLVEKKGLSKN